MATTKKSSALEQLPVKEAVAQPKVIKAEPEPVVTEEVQAGYHSRVFPKK